MRPRTTTAVALVGAGTVGTLAFVGGYLLGRRASASASAAQTEKAAGLRQATTPGPAGTLAASSSSAEAGDEEKRKSRLQGIRFWREGEEFEQVREIVRKVVPEAKAVQPTDIEIQAVQGGITNKLYRASLGKDGLAVLVRVFGAEGMIDRQVENATYIWLAKENIAPGYYGRFLNGRVEEYYSGYLPFTLDDMLDSKLSELVAKQLARLHKLKVPPEIRKLHPGVGLWKTLDGWLNQAKNQKRHVPSSQLPSPLDSPMPSPLPSSTPSPNRSDGEKETKTEGGMELLPPALKSSQGSCSAETAKDIGREDNERREQKTLLPKEAIEEYFSVDFNRCAVKIRSLRKTVDRGGNLRIVTKTSPGKIAIDRKEGDEQIVFCHNDLLCGNILRNRSNTVVRLIDFEYGEMGYRGFDIANHFNEWAGGTLTSEVDKPGFNGIPDYSRFPSKEQQYAFCKAYLEEIRERNVEEREVKSLLQEVQDFIVINHFYWGLWAINRAFEEGVNEFDYMQYGLIRIMRGLLDGEEAC